MHALTLLNSLINAVRTGTVTAPNYGVRMMASSVPPTPEPSPPPPPSSSSRCFIDIGVNLLDSMFEGDYRGKQAHSPDIDSVLARARAAGVQRAIVTAGSLEESRRAIEFIRKRRNAGTDDVALYSTVGVHPTRALEFLPEPELTEVKEAMAALAEFTAPDADAAKRDDAAARASAETALTNVEQRVLQADKVRASIRDHVAELEKVIVEGCKEGIVVAIGECGLDYDRLFFCPKLTQQACFDAQLDLADKTGLPLFLHNRASTSDFASICAAGKERISKGGGVVHSFDGDESELDQLLDLGFDIGLNGCSLKTKDNLDVAAKVPLDKLHLETDAPWCGIKKTHAGHGYVKPLLDPSTGAAYPEVKKEKWQEGACVKDRCEPCHIAHVLQVISGAANAEESRVADAAYENSMRVFFPSERK